MLPTFFSGTRSWQLRMLPMGHEANDQRLPLTVYLQIKYFVVNQVSLHTLPKLFWSLLVRIQTKGRYEVMMYHQLLPKAMCFIIQLGRHKQLTGLRLTYRYVSCTVIQQQSACHTLVMYAASVGFSPRTSQHGMARLGSCWTVLCMWHILSLTQALMKNGGGGM